MAEGEQCYSSMCLKEWNGTQFWKRYNILDADGTKIFPRFYKKVVNLERSWFEEKVVMAAEILQRFSFLAYNLIYVQIFYSPLTYFHITHTPIGKLRDYEMNHVVALYPVNCQYLIKY